jgi:hypothetical protein
VYLIQFLVDFVAASGFLICLQSYYSWILICFLDQIIGYDAFLISCVLCEGNTKSHSVKEEIPGC